MARMSMAPKGPRSTGNKKADKMESKYSKKSAEKASLSNADNKVKAKKLLKKDMPGSERKGKMSKRDY